MCHGGSNTMPPTPPHLTANFKPPEVAVHCEWCTQAHACCGYEVEGPNGPLVAFRPAFCMLRTHSLQIMHLRKRRFGVYRVPFVKGRAFCLTMQGFAEAC